MIQLLTQADGVSEDDVHGLYSGQDRKRSGDDKATQGMGTSKKAERPD